MSSLEVILIITLAIHIIENMILQYRLSQKQEQFFNDNIEQFSIYAEQKYRIKLLEKELSFKENELNKKEK
jgi:hypothetical protein